MRVLWLYYNNPIGDINGSARRLHYGLFQRFANRSRVELFAYGPLTAGLDIEVPVEYNSKLLMRDIRDKIKPDIVIMYSLGNVREWLPVDFKDISIPKVMIECDWWFIKGRDRRWYKEHGVDFMIQRGSVNAQGTGLRSTWLPFSASERDFVQFQKIKLKDRPYRMGFIGRGSGSRYTYIGVYQNRHRIVSELADHNLVKVKGEVGHSGYPIELSKFQCCVSDCGRLHSPPGKVFEIMASGALLFTDPFNGHDELFGAQEVCKFYNTSGVGLVGTAKHILSLHVDHWQEIVDRGVKIINEKHLHRHRAAELEHILRSYIETRNVERRWGR